MAHPSKRKGNTYEREIVDQAKEAGFKAERAWGSDGRSLGLTSDVDCLIANYKVQAKRRANIANYVTPSENVDIQLIRADYEESYVVMKYTDFLELIKDNK